MTGLRIPMVFEGDLAQITACHLKENELVYITGQISGEPPPFNIELRQTSIQMSLMHAYKHGQECLVKLPVKESTRPIDLILHSDVRAVEHAEFDHHLEEEEEIRRLRRELVPRAQPMPYFERPFIPKSSLKHQTIPKEPKFHNPQHKKIKCLSWNDINSLYHQH